MYGFMFYTVANEHLNLDIDPKTGFALPSQKLSSR